jgi:NTP pyrophosphatase (non-canonical NTP hydrolase)
MSATWEPKTAEEFFAEICKQVWRERVHQIEKYGDDTQWSPAQMYLILDAEVGEVARAMKDIEFGMFYAVGDDTQAERIEYGKSCARSELVQVMATCFALLQRIEL